MAGFRIAIGSSSCEVSEKKGAPGRGVCERVLTQLDYFRNLAPDQQASLPEERFETAYIDNKSVSLVTYRKNLEAGTLIVVQAFLRTWRFPTYFSALGIGKMFVDGIVVEGGRVRKANDQELWPFR